MSALHELGQRIRPLVSRFSLRTFGMLLCVYIWIGIGVGQLFDVPTIRPGVFHLLIPGAVRAALWWVPAMVGLACAWSHRASPIALGVLWVPPALVLVSYGIGWAMSAVPGGSPGYANGWYSAYLYLGLVGLVVFTALVPSRAKGRP